MAETTTSIDGNAQQDQNKPIGFTKSKKLGFFKIKSKPIYDNKKNQKPLDNEKTVSNNNSTTNTNQNSNVTKQNEEEKDKNNNQNTKNQNKKQSMYITRILINKKGLDSSLTDINFKGTPYDFIKRMILFSIIISVVVAILIFAIMIKLNVSPIGSVIISLVSLIAMYNVFFNNFINYPLARGKKIGKEIDKDILFATRDIVISMRSGMPLFNAMTSVSTGYGWASHEFGKIVSLAQLGMPVEQAIEEVSEKSYSKTFKRVMLQAGISIRVGADITTSLQGVIDDIMQERVIELRRYGQRLNALAMFYMIFGVIFPSMGIAVAAIMTTFISLITIDTTTLILTLVFIVGIQLIFLNLIKSSRPSFSM
ncbi:MAG: type II secretion system F family protein [Candidatus Micrarchaeaceae archaeon]